jgi:type I restriction enzyme S subunit
MSKKQKTATEFLKEVLVPNEEQPYKVPDNWFYFKFTSLLDIQGGTQPPKSQFVDEEREGYVRLVQIRDFSTDKYKTFVPDTPKLRKIKEDDILIARYGASIGRILTGLSGAYNVALAKVVYPKEIINRKYLFWLLKSEHFQIPLMGLSRSAQSGFNKNDLSYFKLPLPPLGEQKRIAKKLEKYFSKIDEAKRLIEEIKETFELRRVAILDKAFRGELTKKWREQNNITFNWKEIRLEELIKNGPQNGIYKPQSAYGNGILIVRIDNFYNGKINDWDTLKRLQLEQKEIDLYGLNNNDILINRVNSIEYLGKSALVKGLDEPCVFESNVMRIVLNEKVIPEYLILYLNSARGLQELRKNAKHAVNQASINQQDVRNVLVPIPNKEEQSEIVSLVNHLLEKEQNAGIYSDIFNEIELLKKSILSKAFRGELGTNDPNEENALELLKEILSDKAGR